MSYSFSVTAATKNEAIQKVSEQLDAVVSGQPVHAADKAQALAAAVIFVNVLMDDPAKDIVVSLNGSIWSTENGVAQLNVGVSAGLRDKTPAAV